MAIYRISPSVGPDLTTIVPKDEAWYDPAGKGAAGADQAMTPQTGTTCEGSDGRRYIWVQAGAALTLGGSEVQLELTLTSGDYIATTGTEGYYALKKSEYPGEPATIPKDARFWAAIGAAIT